LPKKNATVTRKGETVAMHKVRIRTKEESKLEVPDQVHRDPAFHEVFVLVGKRNFISGTSTEIIGKL
jgi:hypothetical protein